MNVPVVATAAADLLRRGVTLRVRFPVRLARAALGIVATAVTTPWPTWVHG